MNILLSLAAIVACTIAAPAIQSCTPDLFAYCNKSVSDTELDNNLQALYVESDGMIDLLETVCTAATCGDDCDIPVVTLTDDRDVQNDAVNGRLQILQSQLLQLDDYCSAEGTVIDTPPSSTLCETVRNELQQLTQKIAVYLEKEKCGCNSKCFYNPDDTSTITIEPIPVEKLPCKFYITVAVIEEILDAILRKRDI
ncbi:uncharacterized protein [Dysidea avara]|uniref:uncharacterized protein n=1 Tax=Dysidea avara TaxID=196820 RepID=UPI00332AF309